MAWNVLLYADAPNPDGIPPQWPAQIQRVDDAAPLPVAPVQRMSQGQLDAHMASARPAYDSWLIARDTAIANAAANLRRTREQLISDTIADIDLALANWDTLTNAQQKAVLRRLAVIVRAMLKDELR